MSLVLNGNGNGKHVSTSPSPFSPVAASTENNVTFRTADGTQRHGLIVRVTPHSAHFEVHDPTLILRLSETLQDFKINFQGQNACCGRAVICRVVESGYKSACEASLLDMNWSSLVPNQTSRQSQSIDEQFNVFLNRWKTQCKIRPEFKNAAIDLLSFFNDSQVWLNQIELGIRNLPILDQPKAEQDVLLQINPHFTRASGNINETFEHELNQVDKDLRPLHQVFVRKFLHPVTQSSPFMHRAYEKPLGYAGDYEMVDMMFRSPFEGGSYFAKLLNSYALQLPPVVAHRNRIQYLQKKLADESMRMLSKGKGLSVFNLGCGPAREVQQFLTDSSLSNRASFVLADFEDKTLVHTNHTLNMLRSRYQRGSQIKTVKLSVNQLIKRHEKSEKQASREQFNFIYCAGLFDYLTDAVCLRLMEVFYTMLAPDGLLVATNVDIHGAINQMECFLDWHLNYRDTEQMRALTPVQVSPGDVSIKRDPSGANVFIEIRKPGS